jgi:hypothetical protein
VRIPDITEEDVAPMWVGTGNNLTFRGVSPRIESQSGMDPFVPNPNAGRQLAEDGEPGNYIIPEGQQTAPPPPAPYTNPQGNAPSDPFKKQESPNNPPDVNRPPDQEQESSGATAASAVDTRRNPAAAAPQADLAALRLSPRIGPQPASIGLTAGESKVWTVVGMDLDGLSANELVLHFNTRALNVTDVTLGKALLIDPAQPPAVTVDPNAGTIRVKSSDGKPLRFISGGEVLAIRVHGGLTGETFLVMENPNFRTRDGQEIVAAVAGGRVRVE